MRKIVAAGSLLVDKIYGISAYPGAGELTKIRSLSLAGGGLVHNTGRDVKIFAPDIPVSAFGMVGDDDNGRFVVSELRKTGIDVDGIKISPGSVTSFTDVMNVPGGERTFFTYPGASAEWGWDDFPFDLVQPGDIVLLGYFLLLDKIDRGDGVRILRELKRRGADTAIDLVTENSDRYRLVGEALPFVDYLVVNEVEAARLAGFDAEPAELCRALLNAGVNKRVVVHMPEKGVTLRRGGEIVEVESIKPPEGFIQGKTGAGDAYCAGALVGIFRSLSDSGILELGALAAVGALSRPGATEGMKSEAELRRLVKSFS